MLVNSVSQHPKGTEQGEEIVILLAHVDFTFTEVARTDLPQCCHFQQQFGVHHNI